MDLIKMLDQQNLKAEAPEIRVGDTVRVHIKIKEGAKERIQTFEGTVIAKKHGGVNETFTVRRISYGVGVEKVFPVHSPLVEKVELVRKGNSDAPVCDSGTLLALVTDLDLTLPGVPSVPFDGAAAAQVVLDYLKREGRL